MPGERPGAGLGAGASASGSVRAGAARTDGRGSRAGDGPPVRGSLRGGPPMRIALGCGTRRAPVNGDVRNRRVCACSDEPSAPRAACALSFGGDGTRIAGTRLAEMGVCVGAVRGVSISARASFCSLVCAGDAALGALDGDEKTSAAAGIWGGACGAREPTLRGEMGGPAAVSYTHLTLPTKRIV